MASSILDEALAYVARGLPVFPCKPDKKPYTTHGFKDATTNVAQVETWFGKQWPAAMLGLPTGPATDLHVIDVDVHAADGFKTLKRLDLSLEDVPQAATPSGGLHIYHRLGGKSLRNTAGKLGDGLDTRAVGGYVVAPPSRPNPAKPPYAWVNGGLDSLLAAPLLPDFIAKLLADTGKRSPQQVLEDECIRVENATEGTRNDLLNRAAYRCAKLVGGKDGLSEHAIRADLARAALKAGLAIKAIEATLDSAFDAVRREGKGTRPDVDGKKPQGRPLELPEPTPWETEVNGAQLLQALVDDLRAYIVTTEEESIATALWVLHTHVFEAFRITPRLGITSPISQCGKTTLLDWLAALVPRRLEAANITASATFRAIELAKPTLLIDEADSFLKTSDELRGILNSGHRRGGSVIRSVGESFEPRQFGTWCPCAIALIGRLPTTLRNRSIPISLRRRAKGETVQSLESDSDSEHELGRMCARWAKDNKDALARIRPDMPEQLVNRTADNWRPLFSIAQLAGGEWPERVRKAALALSDFEDVTSQGLQLLADVRAVFAGFNGGRDLSLEVIKDESPTKVGCCLPTEDLIAALVLDPEKPWQDYSHGRMLQPRQLAGLLKPWRIGPKDIHPNGARTPVRGYLLADFADAFSRYLAAFPEKEAEETAT